MTVNRFVLAALLGLACSMLSVVTNARDSPMSELALINTNLVVMDNNFSIASSSVAAVHTDTLKFPEANIFIPAGVYLMSKAEPIQETSGPQKEELNDLETAGPIGRHQRLRFCFRREPSIVCGWRYPIDFWTHHGRFIYGSACPYNRPFGVFFYC